ncbi:MAG: LysR family transcriptional regulator [Proteobacteria bacterium]|nr:LysR family transcriptional regulator [Pseudomonadota bacterium]
MVWLRSFDAAARHANFTHAAAELCVTQGAVSQQVKQLEAALHRPLFVRNGRTLALTPAGERLYAVVNDAFRSIDATLAQLRRTLDPQVVVLSCSPSFAMGWLTPRLGSFFREHPEIDLKVHGEFQGLDRARLLHASIDAAVRFDLGNYGDLEARKFLDEWLLPVASPSFVAAHPELRDPSDLRPEWLLHDTSPWDGADEFEEWEFWLEQADVHLPDLFLGHQFNLSQLAQAAAVAGQGVAMGRAALVLDDLIAGRLVDLFGMRMASKASYFFVTPIETNATVALIEHWLQVEAQAFLKARTKFMQR